MIKARIFFTYLVMAALVISSAAGINQCAKAFIRKKTETTTTADNRQPSSPAQAVATCSFSPAVVEDQNAEPTEIPVVVTTTKTTSESFHPQHYSNPPFAPPRLLL